MYIFPNDNKARLTVSAQKQSQIINQILLLI